MYADEAKKLTDINNTDKCKAIFCLIVEAISEGKYEINLDGSMLTDSKGIYLKNCGFQVYGSTDKTYRISW